MSSSSQAKYTLYGNATYSSSRTITLASMINDPAAVTLDLDSVIPACQELVLVQELDRFRRKVMSGNPPGKGELLDQLRDLSHSDEVTEWLSSEPATQGVMAWTISLSLEVSEEGFQAQADGDGTKGEWITVSWDLYKNYANVSTPGEQKEKKWDIQIEEDAEGIYKVNLV